MADIQLSTQSVPATPSAGNVLQWSDSAGGTSCERGSDGRVWGTVRNYSIADQATVAATDTYLTGSRLLVPSCGLQVGTRFTVTAAVSKGAVGTGAPVYNVRLGTAGTIADTSVWTHTGVTQTAIAETGWWELRLTLRSIGVAAQFQGTLIWFRTGGTAATGFAAVPVATVLGATFNSTWVSGQGIGVSVNASTGGVWTFNQVISEMDI